MASRGPNTAMLKSCSVQRMPPRLVGDQRFGMGAAARAADLRVHVERCDGSPCWSAPGPSHTWFQRWPAMSARSITV